MVQGSFFDLDDGKTVSDLKAPIVFNIGYYGKTVGELIAKLEHNKIEILVDLRSKPWSRDHSYNKKELQREIEANGIKYMWRGKTLGGMGVGRQAWKEALIPLAEHAGKQRICIMCMESSVNQCHRKELCKILREDHSLQTVDL